MAEAPLRIVLVAGLCLLAIRTVAEAQRVFADNGFAPVGLPAP